MRLPQLFLAAVLFTLAAPSIHAAPKTPYGRAMTPFVAELNRQCPGRDLQDLSAGDLELIMEGFVERLTPAQRHKVEDAVGYRCARVEAGLTCANIASLDTFHRLGVLGSFVREACATKWTCKAFAACTQTQP
ncbi:hypothetical protein [Phenylobacterium sp.]|jgi:hypothetical protein|uniref:hypothetical protein n=1 Tax=Phenylobacterium sp. TaxID=1871053 RepID=UPI002E2F703E|nr:hypothetical protein [Phenylobacterium sp.]HEX3366666.1 hypothetical protein [Phenylobacterium sp.]